MIDRKKIAEKLRKIAEECAISGSIAVNKTNAALYAAADELDPPEPKPLLADAKVGDLCQRRDGKWVQIERTEHHDCDGIDYIVVDRCYYNLYGRSMVSDYAKDIVHTEPLAPEGSAEWAVQRMKLGDMVCNSVQEFVGYWSIVNGYCFHAHSGHRCSPEKFLSLVNVKTGWQLYTEPQPETEPAKEPEIVAHKQQANCLVCGKVIEGLLDGHATVSIKRYSISSLYESTYSHYCGKCFLELGFDTIERELRNRQQPIAEPAKEQFEVGDWVRGKSGYAYQITAYPSKLLPDNPNVYDAIPASCMDGPSLCLELSDIESKLDPSEVVVHIGCLRGTVAPGCSDTTIMIVPIGYNGFSDVGIIPVAMLDAPTRELVESLLKAQEEI